MSEDNAGREGQLYREPEDAGNRYRAAQLDEMETWIAAQQRQSADRRARYFTPDYADCAAYAASTTSYRQDLADLLGLPSAVLEAQSLLQPAASGEARYEQVAADELGTVYRVTIPVAEGLHAYGLFLRPPGAGPFPLVVAQHGGQGTPELTAGFFGSANYNDMTRRIVRRGAAVFAPQLLLWEGGRFGPRFDRRQIDTRLKQLGISIAGLELYKLRRSLDVLLQRPDLDAARVGMAGLSYGGFYTLFAAALDPRIAVAVSSCYVNDRYAYPWSDWTWPGAGVRFLDAEVCGLICPRPLYLEGGAADTVFAANGFLTESARARAHYERLGLGERFSAVLFEGGHEFNTGAAPLDFLFSHL
ncbi:dienelactone hydrolase family protein [Paenibacillus sp. IB182496]|uniref:Dienelactone hydrolase family protein n=1 Tax=Paenibacillus sabuli TaxID=2772509 RepID=A0A927GT43_9BACL|nr:dienelactone hydrolase family protein [Paenibacillus sabuli]MBD2846332.1 dienelactone hydrolase family protein [Paenibacillus sabuli]